MKTKFDISLRHFALIVLTSLLMLSFVLATYNIFLSNGTVRSVTEDTSNLYNVSLNISAAAVANVSQFNITVPSTFTIDANTNGTSLNNIYTLTIANGVLSFTNITGGLANATIPAKNTSFWFNATATTPGTYNFAVVLRNDTGLTFTNLTVVVNDTTAPSLITFNTPSNYANASGQLNFNISVTDNGAISQVYLNITNSTGRQVSFNQTTNASTKNNISLGNPYNATIDLSRLVDGYYNITVFANDTGDTSSGTAAQNLNSSSYIRIFVDNTKPVISLSSILGTKTTFSLSAILSETGIGVASTCSVSGVTGGWTVNNQNSTYFEVSGSGLDCGTYYNVNVSCTDYASNIGSRNLTVLTSECQASGGSSSSSSSGGSSSSSSVNAWSKTVANDEVELSNQPPVSVSLKSNERTRLKVGSDTHYVGIKSMESTSAVIQVESTPQTANMNVGDTKKFDVDGNGYYDISITLVSISGGKANVSIASINEKVPSSTPASTGTSTSPQAEQTSVPSESTDNSQRAADTSGANASAEEAEDGSNALVSGVIVLAILLVLGAIYYVARKRRY